MNWSVIVPLLLYLVVLIPIGWWAYSRRASAATGEKSATYYIGGRSLGPWVLVFTLLASAASAGTFIGAPGLAYEGGYGWVLGALFQVPAAVMTFGLLGKKFAILSRKLNVVTLTEFLRHRYESRAVVLLSSVGMVLFLVAYMVAQFIGGARILTAVTGVPYTVLIVVFAGIVALYTGFGGFLADAITDTAQGVIMLVGGVVLWVAVFTFAGGTEQVNTGLTQDHPGLLTLPGDSGFDPSFMLSYSVMFGLLLVALPHVAVRAMAYRDSRAVHSAMVSGSIIMAVFTLGFSAMGPIARYFYPDQPIGDLALPNMIIEVLPGPLAGALLAAPLAAIMSTVDSMILIVSGAIVRDLYVGFVNPRMTDRQMTTAGTAVSVSLGVLVLLLALQPPTYLQTLINFAIGGLEASLFVPLVLGLYWKRGNALGAILAIASGMSWYVVATQWVPALALGMVPVVTATAVALVLYLVAGFVGPKPSRRALVKFWGTNAEVQRVLADERAEART